MSSVILTYDVQQTSSDIHGALKKLLIETYGFMEEIQSTREGTNGKMYHLPNTTLKKKDTSPDEAAVLFQKACAEVGARWEKFIVCNYRLAVFNNQEALT